MMVSDVLSLKEAGWPINFPSVDHLPLSFYRALLLKEEILSKICRNHSAILKSKTQVLQELSQSAMENVPYL